MYEDGTENPYISCSRGVGIWTKMEFKIHSMGSQDCSDIN